MTSGGKKVLIASFVLVLAISLSIIVIAQASLPIPPPSLFQGLPELPGSEGAAPVVSPAASSSSAPVSLDSAQAPIEPETIITQSVPQPSAPQITQSSVNPEDVSARLSSIESRISALEEKVNSQPSIESPALIGSPFSLPILFTINIITIGLVLFLLHKSKSKPVSRSHPEESAPLKNIKDYMRRYQTQGYDVNAMKTFLIDQGYPSDLVERASLEMQRENAFQF